LLVEEKLKKDGLTTTFEQGKQLKLI